MLIVAPPGSSTYTGVHWDDLPEEERLRELRGRLKKWRRLLPCDYSGVTVALRDMIRETLVQHPELRRRRPERSDTRLRAHHGAA